MIFPSALAPDGCAAKDISPETLLARAKMLTFDETFRKRLAASFETQKDEYAPSPHVEKQIYDGFFSFADQKLMTAFHDADWSKRLAIVAQFQDPRLKAIGLQLMHSERPDLLEKHTREEQALLAAKRLLGRGCGTQLVRDCILFR